MTAPAVSRAWPVTRQPVPLSRVDVRLVRLPLVEPFETSNERFESRLIMIVTLTSGAVTGWGEVVAAEAPAYSYETVETARHVIRDFLAPAVLASPIAGLQDLAARLAVFTGHPMAKAGVELAYLDLVSQLESQSLATMLSGSRTEVDVGVSLGIQRSIDDLLERVDRYLALGYQRIKLKIKPGWDVDVVRDVRRHHPDILLSVDANNAYALRDRALLARLDAFNLLMIEQPLHLDDLMDHAELQRSLRTPICLDESITGVRRAQQALAIGACRMINIKVGRVGGYSEALAIHDLCVSRGVPVWCGGMLESGIGRAHNIALASLPGFVLPGDISASSRYFERDLIAPTVEVTSRGTIPVPTTAGLGYSVDLDYVEDRTVAREVLR